MAGALDFERSLDLRQISEDSFENVHQPWTWAHSGVVPGGVLMSMSAAAAYRTVPHGYVLANLQTHFLSASKASVPFIYRVKKLSSGRRFAVRSVTAEQDGRATTTTTLSFVNASSSAGPAMHYSVSRTVLEVPADVEHDDLREGHTRFGPWMKFQRLPTVPHPRVASQSRIAPVVARISSLIRAAPGSVAHVLGVINLSDYHMLDAPLTLSGITFGLPEIGSKEETANPSSRSTTKNHVKMNTSLSHSIHFHVHDGFRADDVSYIEVSSPWARNGRAMLQSRIFTKEGLLVATCAQEGYYVLNAGAESTVHGKL